MENTPALSPAKYKDLYSMIAPVPMILANSAEEHIEYNEPLYTAMREYNENCYGNEPISSLIDYGFSSKHENIQKMLDECLVDGITSKTPFELDTSIEDEQTLYEELMEWISDADYPDIYQTYITDESGYNLFRDYGYPVWYNEEMDLHFVGITHYGTAWSLIMSKQYPIQNHDYYLTDEAFNEKWIQEHKDRLDKASK